MEHPAGICDVGQAMLFATVRHRVNSTKLKSKKVARRKWKKEKYEKMLARNKKMFRDVRRKKLRSCGTNYRK